jgi:RNA polymerase sigma-70 factor (ECF subfamily)
MRSWRDYGSTPAERLPARPGSATRDLSPGVQRTSVVSVSEETWFRRPVVEGWRRVRDAPDEAALVRQAQRGSQDALGALFSRHWSSLYRAALAVTGDPGAAEDVAQEAFLRAVHALDRFDHRRPLGPWLHRIAVNRAIDLARVRAARRELSAEHEAADGAASDVLGSLDRIAALVATLPPDQRAVVALRYILDYTPGEIADLLDLPRGTVNSRLRRALDALATSLDEDGER